jgi:hypothetical protein
MCLQQLYSFPCFFISVSFFFFFSVVVVVVGLQSGGESHQSFGDFDGEGKEHLSIGFALFVHAKGLNASTTQ